MFIEAPRPTRPYGSQPVPHRIPPPDARGQGYFGPSLSPDVLRAIVHLVGQAAHKPVQAAQWLADQEGRTNRFYALQEALVPVAGRQRSSQWAWDMLNPHGPYQRDIHRSFIHPVGR